MTRRPMSARRARAILEQARLEKAPDWSDSRTWHVVADEQVLVVVAPSYGGTSRSGHNGWTWRLAALGPSGGGRHETTIEKAAARGLADFTETDWSADGYFEREREAKAWLGVEFDTYCSGDYPMYLLAAKVITVYRGSVEHIDMAALAVEPEMNGWDEKLRAAVQTLGITPTQDKPKWLLCSYRG